MTYVKIFGLLNTAHFRCKLKNKCEKITLNTSIFKKITTYYWKDQKLLSCYFSSCTLIRATLSLLLMKPEERWPVAKVSFNFFAQSSGLVLICPPKGSPATKGVKDSPSRALGTAPVPVFASYNIKWERESEIKQQVSRKNCFLGLRIDKLMVPPK